MHCEKDRKSEGSQGVNHGNRSQLKVESPCGPRFVIEKEKARYNLHWNDNDFQAGISQPLERFSFMAGVFFTGWGSPLNMPEV